MTEEQKEKLKEYNKRYRQNMTEEQREERKESNKRRLQNRTEEQKNKTITPPLKQTPSKNTTKSKKPTHIVIQTKLWYILGSPKTNQ